MKKNHALWMLIGCVLPILLILLFPLFGIGGKWPLIIFIILMLGCHLFMINWNKKGAHRERNTEHKENNYGRY